MFMKRLFFAGFLSFALARLASGQDFLYENDGVVNTPPVIDATNFVNNGLFAFNIEFHSYQHQWHHLYHCNQHFCRLSIFRMSKIIPIGTSCRATTGLFLTRPRRCPAPGTQPPILSMPIPARYWEVRRANIIVAGLVIITGAGVPVLKVNSTNVINTGIMDVGA